MIKFMQGDMFKTGCVAVINPCNCVGVGGKGISLYLKNRAPANFAFYKDVCKRKQMYPGKCLVSSTTELSPSIEYIINFPTKNDWRDPSNIDYIREGVANLVRTMKDFGIESVAVPMLGCGCGGLKWDDVKPAIIEVLNYQGHDGLLFEIYEQN